MPTIHFISVHMPEWTLDNLPEFLVIIVSTALKCSFKEI